MDIRVAHTADTGPAVLEVARTLLLDAFYGDFGDEDWDHSLGGMHAFAWDGDTLVGHGAIVARRLVHGGRALRAGYVEGVAVHANHRRRGVASALMTALERIARGGYDLGALSASEAAVPLYVGRGWQRWQGATWAMTPKGPERTEDDDDAVYVLPVTASLDLTGDLTCDWRDGDVW